MLNDLTDTVRETIKSGARKLTDKSDPLGRPSASQDPTLRESGVDEAAAHVRPVFGVTTADNDDVGRQPQTAERSAQPNGLPGLIVDMGLNDEEVDIAVGIGLAAGMGAEEDHARSGCGRGEAAPGLCDQGFIDDLHRGAS